MKVDEYIMRDVNRDVRAFADQVTLIMNYGKYSAQVVSSPPQWTAKNGEFVFFQSSTTSGNRVYFYANNQWNWMSGSPTGGGSPPGGQDTHVQYNSGGIFGADSGLRYLSATGVGVCSDMRVILNIDDGSDTYLSHNGSNNYTELYIDGTLRVQF